MMKRQLLISMVRDGTLKLVDLDGNVFSESWQKNGPYYLTSSVREYKDLVEIFESPNSLEGKILSLRSTGTEIMVLWRSSDSPIYQQMRAEIQIPKLTDT